MVKINPMLEVDRQLAAMRRVSCGVWWWTREVPFAYGDIQASTGGRVNVRTFDVTTEAVQDAVLAVLALNWLTKTPN